MMSMSTSRTSVIKAVDDNIGFEFSDDFNYFSCNSGFVPKLKSFIGMFTETKVFCTGKKLMSAVNFSGFQQFSGPDYSQDIREFGAYQILTAVAARQG